VTEPDWEVDLRETVNAWVLGSLMVKGGAYAAFKRHVEAAYERGLMAGRSQAGYGARRKPRKEKPKWYTLAPPETPSAPDASGTTPASAGDE
jgi:hypothetical protein